MKTTSSCIYHYVNMSFTSARNVSQASPSTNIPILCTLCSPQPTTVWKYNILSHLITEHAFLKPLDGGLHLPTLPDKMWLDIYISFQEESLMMKRVRKEPLTREELTNMRIQDGAPDSDMVEEIQANMKSIEETRKNLRGRKRALTTSTVNRPWKKPLFTA